MEGKFTGTLEVQIPFQEHIYQCLEQGIPFICATKDMFAKIKDPDMFMEYLDKVSSMCRFKGNAGERYVVYPKGYKFKPLPPEPTDTPPKRYA